MCCSPWVRSDQRSQARQHLCQKLLGGVEEGPDTAATASGGGEQRQGGSSQAPALAKIMRLRGADQMAIGAARRRLRRLPVAFFFSTEPSSHGCPLHAELARRGVLAAASFALYSRIRAATPPTAFTFSLLLAALASSPSAGCTGLIAHAQALKCGALAHPVVTNSLLKLYCALGLLPCARRVFDSGAALDVASWNTMVSGYGKSGDLAAARQVFGRMPERNLVSWSAMVDTLVRAGEFGEALWVFDRMMLESLKPDVVVLFSVLKACAHLGVVERGRWVHQYLETEGVAGRQSNVLVETALVDMYCKCGCMEEAWFVFDSVHCCDVVLWNSMIGGLAVNGHGRVDEGSHIFSRCGAMGLSHRGSTMGA
uniref:Uncharacterized protein n=1 Tax=Avena sativa TaxID=4498 RepID=A0ACD5YUG6_AVESA